MEQELTHASAKIVGRIDKKVHDVSELRESVDGWDELTHSEKRIASRTVDPVHEETVYNVTTDRFHEYLVDNLDPGQTGTGSNLTAAYLALGDDSASGTATTDTDLNNRLYSEEVTDHADNGKDLLCSTFIDSTEANGNSYEELGLFTGDPANLANSDVFMINHTTFSAVTKDNSKTVTFDVTLTFSDA